jgi:AcrR family transcriptional regulator
MRASSPSARLGRDLIVDTASSLLEAEGKLTMRILAQQLQVDPMAVYHYFPNKEALVQAVAARRYAQLDAVAAGFGSEDSWQTRLTALSTAYLKLACSSPVLVRTLASGAADSGMPAKHFADAFALATAGLDLKGGRIDSAMHALVDFIHGYALAGMPDEAPWLAELEVLLLGIGALAARGTS